jgi:hypothetical protein
MQRIAKGVRIKHTPNCRHRYTAALKGSPHYGWGNSPQEARECLGKWLEQVIIEEDEEGECAENSQFGAGA